MNEMRQYVCGVGGDRIRIVVASNWAEAKRWTRAKRVRRLRGELVYAADQEEKRAVANRFFGC